MIYPLLHIQNLSINFVSERENVSAVKNVSLQINRGEIVALVGESGSGKSVTALSILQLLPSPPARFTNGQIKFSHIGGQPIDLLQFSNKKNRHNLAVDMQQIRGFKIAMIFQEPMTSLNPVMKCGKQIMEALMQHKKISKEQAKKETLEWMAKVNLPEPERLFHKYPHQISGGQKQRVMIAMAMCCNPSLLICDEPTTALDVTVQKTILQLIMQLQQELNMGVLFITHDLGVVAEIADRVVIMYKGEILEQNTTKELFTSPQHPYTKALIACRPAFHAKGERLPIVDDFLHPKSTTVEVVQSRPKTVSKNVLVQADSLSVSFPISRNLFGKTTSYYTAVNNVSFEIYNGETMGLVGESGCGKTTLSRTLLRLIEPSKGDILFKGKLITQLNNRYLKDFRKEVQLVFQDPFSSLNPQLSISDALEEPLKLLTGDSKKERSKKVAMLLDQVNLPAKYKDRFPHEFSGGQRQRIVIARALALNPTFLVCDESVSALDVSVQAQVLNLLNDLKKKLGLTLLFISHDLSVVRFMSDRLMVMQAGKIVESGNTEEVYQNPKNEYTKQLLSAIPKITA